MRPDFVLLLSAAGLASVAVGALALYFGIRQYVRIVRGIAETPVYRELGIENLPPRASRYFERQTQRLSALGFYPCGDYRVRTTLDHFCRLFLHPDGTIAAEVAYYNLWFRTLRATSFFSLLDDFRGVESADLQVAPQDTLLVLRSYPGASAGQVYGAHHTLLATLQTESGAQPLPLEAEDVAVLAAYLSQIVRVDLLRSHPAPHAEAQAALHQLRTLLEERFAAAAVS